MGSPETFQAVIEDAGDGGAFVRIPFDVEKRYGMKRLPVQATIDGQPYRGTLVRMGGPDHLLLVLKEIRQKIGKTFGDRVTVTITQDTEPRRVEVPPDLREALEGDPLARAAFEKLSYSHQREHVRAIQEARRPETRSRRIAQAIDTLRRGKS